MSNHRLHKGLAWVLLAGLTFVIFMGIVRLIGSHLHPIQAAFIRYALGLIVIVPLFVSHGVALLETRHLLAHGLRGAVHGVAVMLWFYAVARIPLAEATALGFTAPIFVVIGAVLFLGERLTWVRGVSLLVGFLGVLLILRPGMTAIDVGAIVLLISAPLFATSKLLVKFLVRHDSSGTVVAHLSIFATLTMLVPALFVWQTPSWMEMVLLLGTAVFATVSHLCMAKGLALVDVSDAQPVEFVQLVWSSLMGIVFFHEHPSVWVWAGAFVIIFGATFIARAEPSGRLEPTGDAKAPPGSIDP